MSDKVVNLQDKMREENPHTQTAPEAVEEAVENIDLGDIDPAAIMQMLSTGNLEGLEQMGMTPEEIVLYQKQMEQYQKEAKIKQGYALLGQVFGIIQEKWPEEEVIPQIEDGIYEELNEHLINTVIEEMDKCMEETYNKLAVIIKDILIKERTNPFVKPEDRLENKFGPVNTKLYDIVIPGMKLYDCNEEFFAAMQDRKIDDNLVSYKLLEFIIKSVVKDTVLLDESIQNEILNHLAKVKGFLDSIALRKISTQIINDAITSAPEEIKEHVDNVIKELFPPH